MITVEVDRSADFSKGCLDGLRRGPLFTIIEEMNGVVFEV